MSNPSVQSKEHIIALSYAIKTRNSLNGSRVKSVMLFLPWTLPMERIDCPLLVLNTLRTLLVAAKRYLRSQHVRFRVEKYFSSLENMDFGLNVPPPMLTICQEGLFSAADVTSIPASGTPEIDVVTVFNLWLLCRCCLTEDVWSTSELVWLVPLLLSRDSPVRCLFLGLPIALTEQQAQH